MALKSWAQTCGPFSLITVWIRPPPVAPTVFLSTTPNMISPSTINIPLSLGLNKFLPSSNLCKWIPFGIAIDKSCLPDHNGFGLTIAGGGMTPSQFGIQYNMFITWSNSTKLSLKVNLRIPQRVSWTIPMTGLLDCGDTICNGTAQISDNSALVSGD